MADVKRDKDQDGKAGGEGIAVVVTKPVNLAQLTAELTEAMNWRKDTAFTADGDLRNASAEAPATLWALREDTDPDAFVRVVTQHEANPEWSAEPTEEPAPAPSLDAVKTKAAAGEDLSDVEVQVALRALLAEDPKKK